MIRAGHLEQPDAEQYRKDAFVVASAAQSSPARLKARVASGEA
jgi:hypothetical protein